MKPKVTHKIRAITFGKKTGAKVALEYEKALNEMEDSGYDIASIRHGTKYDLIVGRKVDIDPHAMLQELLQTHQFPPGAQLQVMKMTPGGPVPVGPPQATDGDFHLSQEAMQVIGPIKDAMSRVPEYDEKKVLPVIFDKVTENLSVDKMREIATELKRGAEQHQKTCETVDGVPPFNTCKLHPLMMDVVSRLLEKAKMNTQ